MKSDLSLRDSENSKSTKKALKICHNSRNSSQLRDGHVEMPSGVYPEREVPRVDLVALEAVSALGHRLVELNHSHLARRHCHFLHRSLAIRRRIDVLYVPDADLCRILLSQFLKLTELQQIYMPGNSSLLHLGLGRLREPP